MTSNKQIRAVLLAALMVFSVFAGSIAFTGTAAATVTDVSVGSDTVEAGSSASVSVSLTDDGSSGDYTVWLDDGDGVFESGEINETASSTTIDFDLAEAEAGDYNVSAYQGSTTPGSTVADENVSLTVTASEAPQVTSAVHYDDGTPVVEVAFDETVTVNDLNVTKGDSNLTQSISKNKGQLVATLSQVYTDDLEVEYDVTDTSGNSVSGTEDVTFAPVYVANNSNNTAYKGSKVAVLTDSTGVSVEVEGTSDDNNYQFAGSTGDHSQVFIFDTNGKEIDSYDFNIGGNESAAEVDVRDLGLDVSIDDLNITTADSLEGTASAHAGDRTIDVVAIDSDGDEVDGTEQTITLDGQGEADFNLSTLDADDYTVEVTDAYSGVSVESDTVSVTKAKDSTSDFTSTVVNEQVGDIAELNVTLEGTDTATITVGDNDLGYSANVTVEDGNDDGVVTLLFNTYEPKKSSSFDVEDSDDEYTVDDITTEIPEGDLLDAGDYGLEVATGSDADNVATLVLEDRSTDSQTVWTAPTGEDLSDSEAVYEAIENENLTESDAVANGDIVVHQISATGLEGAFDVKDFDTLNGTEFNLTVEQTNPGPNRDPKVLGINGSSATVIADGENDTYFIVYDLDDVSASRTDNYDGNADQLTVEDEDAFNATFHVIADGNLTDSDDGESTSAEFEVVKPELNLDKDEFSVQNAANQSVSGTASVSPGTALTVRVKSDGDTQPRFLKTSTAYVQADGSFSSVFDFSEQNLNDTFEVTVSVDKGVAEDATADGIVGAVAETTTEENTTESTETATATEEPTTEESTETATATEESTEEATEETTESSTPGFGISVALVALVAAALLAVRRD
ncbi:PGF-CTERM sorting domain-containing protein [Haloferax mediterranei ATCC 33500]|uniref:PGF-CTERM sorting domain-containing protein n=1 Tax=Haloferax mediterranei (strain ATCC 33500 / DSM 1411 / JCM 8866 / NBRC 14739 / NCIMB 2177 / R-4) TaxID=523841 RepID=I3R2Z6_HALMT|nr:ArtA-dependent S-layer glycoprotein [Haloferax mediterranei]AFK18606.1 hypothetical protein HFX_0885 [Haloferax mediterranei ATCC 33500]AHZ22022.1 hypothetical protein BM92_04805 [Haloferax mediterranei ATCC 33500]EMA02119.1 hypothetical protein C439_06050 [Haloferax mediterranei ATCC 33500]MDX5988693.1 cell surface glycoprotein [Haloferax mediterranei ATCC 33500]QCQ75104.1 PGF-CTERM sorting domain-containing protein [Haloferax mediterranei ATCC 33500]